MENETKELPRIIYSVPLGNVYIDARGAIVARGFRPDGYHYVCSNGLGLNVWERDEPEEQSTKE